MRAWSAGSLAPGGRGEEVTAGHGFIVSAACAILKIWWRNPSSRTLWKGATTTWSRVSLWLSRATWRGDCSMNGFAHCERSPFLRKRPCSMVLRLYPSTIWSLVAMAALITPMVAERLTGQVVDEQGNPLSGAEIRHTGDKFHEHVSGPHGQFSLDTSAPKVVIGKVGFRSQLVTVAGGGVRKVVLQKLAADEGLPSCKSADRLAMLEAWRARFAFKVVPGLTLSAPTLDVDYVVRFNSVGKRHGIRHAAGALWGPGWPSDQDVWQSVRMEELRFMAGGEITVAQGEFVNGNRWRHLGVFGESAVYSGVDRTTARALDQVMDGACLLAQPSAQ